MKTKESPNQQQTAKPAFVHLPLESILYHCFQIIKKFTPHIHTHIEVTKPTKKQWTFHTPENVEKPLYNWRAEGFFLYIE